MDNLKNPVAAQQYRMKSSIEEYEANGLNSLLMQMLQWALDKRYVSGEDSLIYFNVAYAVAVPLEETPGFSVKLVRKKIEDLFEESSLKKRNHRISQYDTLLSLWMVYGILHLQRHKSLKLNSRLKKIRSELTEDFSLWEISRMKYDSVATKFSAMIDAVKDRFCSPELHEKPSAPELYKKPSAHFSLATFGECDSFQIDTPVSLHEVKPDHRDNGEQPMDLNEMKIQALEAQLEKEKEKNEYCKAIEKSNYLTTSFNQKLEKRCKELERQLKEVLDSHRIEKETMQRIINQKDEQIKLLKAGAMNGIPQGTTGGVTVNNFYGSVAQQSNNANNVSSYMHGWGEQEKKINNL